MTSNTHWKLWELPVVYGPRKPVSGRRADRLTPRTIKAMPASARNKRRRAAGETFTGLLSCKPIDVCLRRLKYEALRKRKAKR